MKHLLLSTALVLTTAGTGLAGTLADPVIEAAPVFAAPAASLWDGFYVGGTLGYVTGETLPAPAVTFDGYGYGAFAGYNYIMDNGFMLGAELAGTMGDMTFSAPPSPLGLTVIDAKLRAGFDAGPALFYVSGGYSMANWSNGASGTGWNLGAGMDYMVTDMFFVGAEYVYRDITDSSTPSTWQDQYGTIQIRAGIKF